MSCPSREQLYGFLEERLEEALRDSIEKHAENCSACQQCLAQLSEANFPLPARERPEYAPKEAFLRRLKKARPETSANLWGTRRLRVDSRRQPDRRPCMATRSRSRGASAGSQR